MTENLLRNWTFCDGMHVQDGIPQIGVPDEWHLDWLDNQTFPGIAPGLVAYRPESVVVDLYSVSPGDQQELFYLNGESTRYTWKIFKGMAPLYAAASQEVHGLTVGQQYKFTMWTYADIVESYINGKHFSADVWAAEARAGVGAANGSWPASADGDVEWGEWHNLNNGLLTFGEYRPVTVEFVAAAADVKVWFEAKAKWGLPNNGWWLWGAKLETVGGETPPPLPTPPTPPPTPPTPPLSGVVELGPESQAFIRSEADRIIARILAALGS